MILLKNRIHWVTSKLGLHWLLNLLRNCCQINIINWNIFHRIILWHKIICRLRVLRSLCGIICFCLKDSHITLFYILNILGKVTNLSHVIDGILIIPWSHIFHYKSHVISLFIISIANQWKFICIVCWKVVERYRDFWSIVVGIIREKLALNHVCSLKIFLFLHYFYFCWWITLFGFFTRLNYCKVDSYQGTDANHQNSDREKYFVQMTDIERSIFGLLLFVHD